MNNNDVRAAQVTRRQAQAFCRGSGDHHRQRFVSLCIRCALLSLSRVSGRLVILSRARRAHSSCAEALHAWTVSGGVGHCTACMQVKHFNKRAHIAVLKAPDYRQRARCARASMPLAVARMTNSTLAQLAQASEFAGAVIGALRSAQSEPCALRHTWLWRVTASQKVVSKSGRRQKCWTENACHCPAACVSVHRSGASSQAGTCSCAVCTYRTTCWCVDRASLIGT